ncbi:MAG: hypothetical protein R2795_11350 [Saprospiraceae bacterium]
MLPNHVMDLLVSCELDGFFQEAMPILKREAPTPVLEAVRTLQWEYKQWQQRYNDGVLSQQALEEKTQNICRELQGLLRHHETSAPPPPMPSPAPSMSPKKGGGLFEKARNVLERWMPTSVFKGEKSSSPRLPDWALDPDLQSPTDL